MRKLLKALPETPAGCQAPGRSPVELTRRMPLRSPLPYRPRVPRVEHFDLVSLFYLLRRRALQLGKGFAYKSGDCVFGGRGCCELPIVREQTLKRLVIELELHPEGRLVDSDIWY